MGFHSHQCSAVYDHCTKTKTGQTLGLNARGVLLIFYCKSMDCLLGATLGGSALYERLRSYLKAHLAGVQSVRGDFRDEFFNSFHLYLAIYLLVQFTLAYVAHPRPRKNTAMKRCCAFMRRNGPGLRRHRPMSIMYFDT